MTNNDAENLVKKFANSDDGPVFNAPWQAQVFGMTVRLYQGGYFSWPEWSERLGKEIEAAKVASEPDTEENYYVCWLRAFEKLVAYKDIMSSSELAQRRDVWDRAAQATPHGKPISIEDYK